MPTPADTGSAPARAEVADLAVDHIELVVADLDSARKTWCERYGFMVAGRNRSGPNHRLALRCDRILLILTQPAGAPDPAATYLQRHGDGVADIALRTADLAATFTAAVEGGAQARHAPSAADGSPPWARVSGFGDVVHTLIERDPDTPTPLPDGFEPEPQPETAPAGPGGLREIDHFAVCLQTGELEPTVRFYQACFGFRSIFTERIVVGRQAMESIVVQSPGGDVTFTMIQPDPRADPGQIDDFLGRHGGSGVQHVAFSTADAVRSVQALSGRGVSFLRTPGTYYDRLAERIDPKAHSLGDLRQTNLLVDEDHGGQLFQIFTASEHPRGTLFFEVIERRGARTFGSANIKALYEAVELERSGHGARA